MCNPNTREYSFQSAFIGGLSRIDLGLGNDFMLPLVESSHYSTRQVSDHSPFLVDLQVGVSKRLEAKSIDGTADIAIVWNAAKAFLRNQFIR